MVDTPKRKKIAASAQSPVHSLIGCQVVIPTEIFPEDKVQYTGQVTGTPSRRKNAVYVKVDQDDTQYWFPATEVSKWVVDKKPDQTTSATTPRRARHKQHIAESSQQHTPATQTADADRSHHTTEAVTPANLADDRDPPAAVQLNDASSCHPHPQEDFTDTLEVLVSV